MNFQQGDGKATIHNWGHTPWKHMLVLSKCKWRSDATIHLHESGCQLERSLVWDQLPKSLVWHDADKQHVENLHDNGHDDSAASSTTMCKHDEKQHDEKQHSNGQRG